MERSRDLLGQGKVHMQINGSWVNSEHKNLGWKADEDYVCLRFPARKGLIYSIAIIFLNGPAAAKKQLQMAQVLLDKEFQRDQRRSTGARDMSVSIKLCNCS